VSEGLESMSASLELFVISFLSLYWEVLLIRWVPSEVTVLGYFTNFVLMACFLGLGLGCLSNRWKPRLLIGYPAAILALIGACFFSKKLRVLAHQTEVLFLDHRSTWFDVSIWMVIPCYFALICLTLIPLGQELGRRFKQVPALAAYSLNTLGSLFGVICFSLFSWLEWPAWVWILLGSLPLLWLMRDQGKILGLNLLVCLLGVGAVYYGDRHCWWSPYQKLSASPFVIDKITGNPYNFEEKAGRDDWVLPEEVGFNLHVNGLSYQTPMSLSSETLKKYPILDHLRLQYDAPYRFGNSRRVLVVGGGSGNDAAAALRNGAEKVDVVDIDPMIVEIGRSKHPDRPYSDPRVTVTIDDARAFFRKNINGPKYDKIAFGLVDSHVLTSGFSNIRIDSYVYTQESFRDACRLLSEDGVLVVNFTIAHDHFAEKLYSMLLNATGEHPLVLSDRQKQVLGVTLAAGPGLRKYAADIPQNQLSGQIPPSTDDWPFFYLLRKSIGSDYLKALSLVLGLSCLGVGLVQRGQARSIEPHFFFLGAAFMLVESRSITSLALVFGSTWQVNSIVLASVLSMIWLSNALIARVRLPLAGLYAGLFATIAIAYLTPTGWLADVGPLVSILLTFSPVFFAGAIFSTSLAQFGESDYALGSNILGCIVGGALEYLSMVVGFRQLWLLVAILYGASLFSRGLWGQRQGKTLSSA